MTDQPLTVLDQVVIASGRQPRSRVFAGVHLLPDGQLLVGYREGSDHLVTDDGAILTTRSADHGRTWSDPMAVFALPGWDCAGGNRSILLPDGSLLMFVFKARWCARENEPAERESHVLTTRSYDGGRTWNAFEGEVQLFDGWTEPYAHGKLLLTADGKWLLPVHGADSLGDTTYSTLSVSSDEGQSWTRRSVIARSGEINYYETDLVCLDNGRWVGVIRTNDPPFDSYRVFSDDDGLTWTDPQRTGFLGPTPRLFTLRSGALLCAYRDRDPQRPGVSVSVSRDDGLTWQYAGQLVPATDWNCGYPDMVRLPAGEIFCVYYTAYQDGDSQVRGLWLRDET